jgi:lysozyme family protein
MLSAHTTPGLGSQPMLVQGRDFNCTSTICYGIGAQNATMLTLQGYINKFANAAGFPPISVDGKIGAGTIAAFRKVVAFVLAKAGPGATMKFGGQDAMSLGLPLVAMFALDIISTLEFWTGALSNPPNSGTSMTNATDTVSSMPASVNMPPISSVPNQGTSSINLPNGTVDTTHPSAGSFGPADQAAAAAMATFTPSSTGVPWWAWAIGGVVVVGGTAMVLTRRKRKAA